MCHILNEFSLKPGRINPLLEGFGFRAQHNALKFAGRDMRGIISNFLMIDRINEWFINVIGNHVKSKSVN
jgi:hypothetical protein